MENKSRELLLLEMECANAQQPEFIRPEDTYAQNPEELFSHTVADLISRERLKPFGTHLKEASKIIKDWVSPN